MNATVENLQTSDSTEASNSAKVTARKVTKKPRLTPEQKFRNKLFLAANMDPLTDSLESDEFFAIIRNATKKSMHVNQLAIFCEPKEMSERTDVDPVFNNLAMRIPTPNILNPYAEVQPSHSEKIAIQLLRDKAMFNPIVVGIISDLDENQKQLLGDNTYQVISGRNRAVAFALLAPGKRLDVTVVTCTHAQAMALARCFNEARKQDSLERTVLLGRELDLTGNPAEVQFSTMKKMPNMIDWIINQSILFPKSELHHSTVDLLRERTKKTARLGITNPELKTMLSPMMTTLKYHLKERFYTLDTTRKFINSLLQATDTFYHTFNELTSDLKYGTTLLTTYSPTLIGERIASHLEKALVNNWALDHETWGKEVAQLMSDFLHYENIHLTVRSMRKDALQQAWNNYLLSRGLETTVSAAIAS